MGGRRPGPWLSALTRDTRSGLREYDLVLTSAGLTFYASIAVVPLLIAVGRVSRAVVGERVWEQSADQLAAALPSAVGAGDAARALLLGAGSVSWWVAAFCLLPASMYGEGLRRGYGAAAGSARGALRGWRGRVGAVPVLGLAPVLMLAVLSATPLLNDLFGSGAWGVVLGVYVALNVVWVVVSVPMVWSFRVIAPLEITWRAALVGGFATGAFVAGFLQGFVLFLALPIDLGAPFGGATEVGGVLALLLWVWLLHVVVLVGWTATLQVVRRRGRAG